MKQLLFSICFILIITPAFSATDSAVTDVNSNLLQSGDDSYKYHRIPGITVKKKKAVEDVNEDIVKMPGVSDASARGSEEKGLLGLNKSTEDFLAKISLIGLIIFIFVLYRFRAGKSGSKRRRYPKK